MLKHYIVILLLASGLSGAITYGGVSTGLFSKPETLTAADHQQLMAMAKSKVSEALPKSISRDQWPEIDQFTINKLTAALQGVAALSDRFPVVIFCQNEFKCGDLALNIENAFESAHWTVTREAPILDDTSGLGVSHQLLLDLFKASTNLQPTLIKANLKGREAIVIGKKK